MREHFQGVRKHKLLPREIEKKLPPLYSNEELPASEVTVHLKLFSPYSQWTWYITELDPESGLAFGLCCGDYAELGYVNLPELEQANTRGLPLVERDCWYTPEKLDTVMQREQKQRNG